jgi:hypothetical protein
MRPRVGSGADPAASRHAARVSTSATISDQRSQTWPLLPRGDERDRLDGLVRAAAAGCAGVAAHHRRSGIGKSAALDYPVQPATGLRVRRIRAVAAELELPYAACVQACEVSGDECDRHAQMHEHCRVCAEVCRRCQQVCEEVLAAIG